MSKSINAVPRNCSRLVKAIMPHRIALLEVKETCTMSQISFADAEHAGQRKEARSEIHLEEMKLVGAVEDRAQVD